MSRKKKLEVYRYRLLQEMMDKGFMYYLSQALDLKTQLTALLKTENKALILQDDLFSSNRFGASTPWWQVESPWSKWSNFFITAPVVHSIVNKQIAEKLANKSNMTEQINLLMSTIMSSYYTGLNVLYPIMLNIEYAVHTSKGGIRGASDDYNLYERFMKFAKEHVATGLSICFAGSGPIILKLLQQYNNDNDEKLEYGIRVKDVVKNIFSNVPSLTPLEMELVKLKLKDGLPPEDRGIIDSMNESPVGSASIAMAFVTRAPRTLEKAVIKFVKPFYMYFYLCECNYLLGKVWRELRKPGVSDILLAQTRQLLMFLIILFCEEFDYGAEYKYTLAGYQLYNQPRLNVYSVRVLTPFQSNPLPALVTSAGPSRNLKDAIDELGKNNDRNGFLQLYNNLINYFEIWFTNIFWGNGFLHADLHAGNILVGPKKDRYYICIIDYGSSGILTPREKNYILEAMLILGKFDASFLPLLVRGDSTCGRSSTTTTDAPPSKRPLPSWLNYFKDLQQDQEALLRPLLISKKLEKAHNTNLRVVLAFVKKILQVCEVKTQMTERELIQVRDNVLNYSSNGYNDFGFLFLQIIKYSQDIGQCTNNSTFIFGKGIAYILGAICSVRAACAGYCKPYDLSKLMVRQIIRNPRMYPKLIKYSRF
jgi:hypothetical protein